MSNQFDNARSLRVWALAVLVVAMLPACRGMKSSKPPIHPNPNMDNVTYVSAQEPSSFFEDGRGMRPLVEGTIARGELRADLHADLGLYGEGGAACTEAADCPGHETCFDGECYIYADVLPAPLTLDRELLGRGQERFGIYCTPCHGDAGLENGGVVPQRAALRGETWLVPSLHGERQRGYAVGQLYDIVTNGFNTMPSYAAQIPNADRWAIAAYVRALQVSYEMPLAELPRDVVNEQGWR